LVIPTVTFCSPIVKGCVQHILEKQGYSCEKKGKGWEEFFEITTKITTKGKSDMTGQFFLHNLYLEIATKDRDDEQLEWDRRLSNSSLFHKKVITKIDEKIRPLLISLSTNNPDKLREKLRKLAKDEGFRMRIAVFDKSKGSKNENK